MNDRRRAADPHPAAAPRADPRVRGSFLGELRRRNVFRMAGLYLVGAWLVVQVADTLLPVFGAPDWAMRALVIALALAFVPVMVASWLFELTPEGLKRDADVPREASIAHVTGRRIEHATVVVLALALAVFAYDRFALAPGRTTAAAEAAAEAAAGEARVATLAGLDDTADDLGIAVLPFENLSPDPEQAYFSDGLAEDLITMLAQFDGLRVIARGSSFQFRDGDATPQAIAQALGVTRLVTGSVRRSDDAIRVNLALIDTGDGRTLWSQRYDRPAGDLFALQDEIVRAVAGELHAQLAGGEARLERYERPKSGDLDAYNAYLRGAHAAFGGDRDSLAAAVAAYEEAIARDPEYVRAHAALARTLQIAITQLGEGAIAPDDVARMRAATTRALELDPESPHALVAAGMLASDFDFDFAAADAALARAATLAPTHPVALVALSQSRSYAGDFAAAAGLAERALTFDPLRRSAITMLFYYRLRADDLDGAEATLRRLQALGTTLTSTQAATALAIRRGDLAAARALADTIPDEEWAEIYRTWIAQLGPDRAAADAALAALIAHQGDVSAFQIAEAHAMRGDADAMFDWLGRALANRDPGLAELHMSPWLARHLDDPRFAAFCRELGVPATPRFPP